MFSERDTHWGVWIYVIRIFASGVNRGVLFSCGIESVTHLYQSRVSMEEAAQGTGRKMSSPYLDWWSLFWPPETQPNKLFNNHAFFFYLLSEFFHGRMENLRGCIGTSVIASKWQQLMELVTNTFTNINCNSQRNCYSRSFLKNRPQDKKYLIFMTQSKKAYFSGKYFDFV